MKIATLFSPGSYGTFISWCVYTFSNLNKEEKIYSPFMESSGHNYRFSTGYYLVTPTHIPLDDLYQNYILVNCDDTKLINYLDNHFQKQLLSDLKAHLQLIFPDAYEKLNRYWGPNIEVWELRELLSFYLHDMFTQTRKQINDAQQQVSHNNCYIVNPEQFLIDCELELLNMLRYFNLQPNNLLNQINEYSADFIKKQQHFNKHELISNFVNQTILGNSTVIENLTMFDEAYIQHLLREREYEIKCYSLNEFPIDSVKLAEVLIK